MELFLVLFLFGMLFFAMEKILLNSVKIFEDREKFSTDSKLLEVEYKERSKTTIYHVEFTDNNNNVLKGKSLQYKGKPRFKVGDSLEIDYLIRDEMKHLIENNLVDVKHPEHKTMYEDLKTPIRFMYYIAIGFFIVSAMALIYWIIF